MCELGSCCGLEAGSGQAGAVLPAIAIAGISPLLKFLEIGLSFNSLLFVLVFILLVISVTAVINFINFMAQPWIWSFEYRRLRPIVR